MVAKKHKRAFVVVRVGARIMELITEMVFMLFKKKM